jgi:thiamine-monophosphate kinase
VSDGLSSDLGHICAESKVGAVIHEESLPRSEILLEAAEAMGKDPLLWMVNGGEDYVLLTAVRPDRVDAVKAAMEEHGCAVHVIGKLLEEPGVHLKRADGTEIPLEPGGWDHFKREG